MYLEPSGFKRYPAYRMLDTIGDGSGGTSGVGDFRVTPRKLKTTVGPNEVINSHMLIINLQDGGAIRPNRYGGIPRLTNGITICMCTTEGLEKHRVLPEPLRSISDLANYALSYDSAQGGSNMMFTARIDLLGIMGEPYRLYPGDTLTVTLNDDLRGLNSHKFVLHGTRHRLGK